MIGLKLGIKEVSELSMCKQQIMRKDRWWEEWYVQNELVK
jgi:hypothetical protein